MSILTGIIECFQDDEILKADGFDEAVIGIEHRTMRLVYSSAKCIDILCREMDYDDAFDYFKFNVEGSYVGEQTPIFVDDMWGENENQKRICQQQQFEQFRL